MSFRKICCINCIQYIAYYDFHNDPVVLTVFSWNPHGLNKADIFSPFWHSSSRWAVRAAKPWCTNFGTSSVWYLRLILSYPIGAKTLCGYDLHEAERNEPGKPRFDLNGTHSSDAFLQNLEQRLQHWSATAQNSPLFTFLSLKERLPTKISFEETDSNDF